MFNTMGGGMAGMAGRGGGTKGRDKGGH